MERDGGSPAQLLHASLQVLLDRSLDRGLWEKLEGGPLAVDMFDRPNYKGLVAALYLLHRAIRGKKRTEQVPAVLHESP